MARRSKVRGGEEIKVRCGEEIKGKVWGGDQR